jgi:hypothetical protein
LGWAGLVLQSAQRYALCFVVAGLSSCDAMVRPVFAVFNIGCRPSTSREGSAPSRCMLWSTSSLPGVDATGWGLAGVSAFLSDCNAAHARHAVFVFGVI